ncbi:MAG: right-handed parallel beta-helix repeat-containing protein [Phycisphaerae bacterium]|nr:right-handed parallel beta-helix repeat-containing protein [Phycisphaerae bacterium]
MTEFLQFPRLLLPCVVALLALSADSAADIIYVNAGQTTGANNGASWEDAFQGRLGVQNALQSAASGDEVWVAAGVYAPAPPNGSSAIAFELPSGVALLGGFAGGETAADQRDPSEHVCTLTGDLNSGAPPARFSHQVVRIINGAIGTLLDGFVIRDGRAISGAAIPIGGCVLVSGGQPAILNCTISDGEAVLRGGGLGIIGGANALIQDCIFTRSKTNFGANAYNANNSFATFRRCSFVGLSLITGGSAGVGIYNGNHTAPGDFATLTVEDCYFSLEERDFTCPSGFAIHSAGQGQVTIRDSRFINNKSCGAGALHLDCSAMIDRCVFIGNEGRFDGGAAIFAFDGDITVSNSLFAGNDREGFATMSVEGSLTVTNCTLVANGNTIPNTAGGGFHRLFHLRGLGPHAIRNSIIWNNQSIDGLANAIVFLGQSSLPTFDRSLVQAWTGQFPGFNNFAAPPLFRDELGADGQPGTLDDDLRLAAGSPAIDRGDNFFLLDGPDRDLNGGVRYHDDPAAPDLGAPLGGAIVDLGAYERHAFCDGGTSGLGDVNCDAVISVGDIAAFVLALTDPLQYPIAIPGCSLLRADLNCDGLVSVGDIGGFVALLTGGE